MDESKVHLQKGGSCEWVEASLSDQITADHLKLWDDGWQRAMRIYCAGIELEDRPEDLHWDWKRKPLRFCNLKIDCVTERLQPQCDLRSW